MNRTHRLLVAAAAACLLASAAQGQSVIVQTYTPNWSHLGSVEQGRMETVLHQSLAVPDSTLAPLINADVAAEADKSDDSGHVTCSGDCPDYDWSVDATGSFAFTQPSLTKLTVLSATQNRVRVEVRSAGKVHLHIFGEAIGGGIAPSADGTLDIDIPITIEASSEIAAWPVWSVGNVQIRVAASSSANISGYTGELFEGAAVTGSLIGNTPLGMAMGGPAAIFSTVFVAGEVAIGEIEDVIEGAVVDAVAEAADKFSAQIEKQIAPALSQGNNLRMQAMNTTLPGVGQSLSQLQSSAGMDLHVRTRQSGGDAQVLATVRFDGKSRGGTVVGEVRFPKQACGSLDTFSFGGGNLTTTGGLEPANTDLVPGQSCAQLLGGGRLGHGARSFSGAAFLGLNPPSESLPEWAAFARGAVGVGSLRETSGWYVCDFRTTGLPNGVLEIGAGASLEQRLGAKQKKRFLVLGSQVFDEQMTPLSGGVEIGGSTRGCEGVGGKVGAFERPRLIQRPERVEPDDLRIRRDAARFGMPGRAGQVHAPVLRAPAMQGTRAPVPGGQVQEVQTPALRRAVRGEEAAAAAAPSSHPAQVRSLSGGRFRLPASPEQEQLQGQ